MRKKKSEMTPVELVDQALKGRSWDEAETAGIEILARCMALHVYARNEKDYVENLFRRICERCDQWAHEIGGIDAVVQRINSFIEEIKRW